MASWQEFAHPRYGFLTVRDALTGTPGQDVAALQLRCTETACYFCVPAGAFQAGFAGGLAELPACDDHGDVIREESLQVEYAAIPSDCVDSFGEALSSEPFPFGLEGLWPDACAALLAMPEGFGEELDDFAREEQALVHRWDDEIGPCMSILAHQRLAKEVHVQAYHFIAREGLVLRTQSLFEHV
jgi:hypothetical protein